MSGRLAEMDRTMLLAALCLEREAGMSLSGEGSRCMVLPEEGSWSMWCAL